MRTCSELCKWGRSMLRPTSADEDGLDRLAVAVGLAGVVPKNDFRIGQLDDVFGEQRDFAAASGRIDDEVRHRQPRGPAAERLDNLQPLLNRGAEVLGARTLVTHIAL